MRSLRILVVTEFLPAADRSGGDRRLVNVLELMARRHRIDLCVDVDQTRLKNPENQLSKNDALRYAREISQLGVRVVGTGLFQAIRSLASGAYDVAIFEFPYFAKRYLGLVRRLLPQTPRIVDSVDVHFLRHAAQIALVGGDPLELAQQKTEELAIYRHSDGVIVVTDVDQAALAAEENMPPLYLLPVIVPMRARAQRVREKSLLFVGGFKHAPNVDGIGWFVRDCWPSIRARVPDAELVVIGGDAPASVLALSAVPGVKLTGWVPDTAPFLDAAAVSIAPLRFGAGMKVKVIEALAAALPVVTTAFGAQGLGATSNVNIMVADDSAAFSDAVCKLLFDPPLAEAIGTAGQQLSDQVCGIGRATMAIDAMLQSATRNRRTRSFRQFLGGLALHQGMAWRQSKTLRAWAAVRFVWNR